MSTPEENVAQRQAGNARFHQPAIATFDGDQPVTRVINVNSCRHRAWVAAVSASYAELSNGTALTTFFQDHP